MDRPQAVHTSLEELTARVRWLAEEACELAAQARANVELAHRLVGANHRGAHAAHLGIEHDYEVAQAARLAVTRHRGTRAPRKAAGR